MEPKVVDNMQIQDCLVPSAMVSKCPICGGDMAQVISDLDSRNSI